MRLLCLSLLATVMLQLLHGDMVAGAQGSSALEAGDTPGFSAGDTPGFLAGDTPGFSAGDTIVAAVDGATDPLDQVSVDPTEGPLMIMLRDVGDTNAAMAEATRRADADRSLIADDLRSAAIEKAALEAAQTQLADRARASRLFDDNARASERAARVGLESVNARIADTERVVADAAISSYMTGQKTATLIVTDDDVPERLRKSVYANDVIGAKTALIADDLAERQRYENDLDVALADRAKAGADLAGIGQLVLTIDARLADERTRIDNSEELEAEIDDRLAMILGSLEKRLAGQNDELRELRKTAMVSGMDFPLVALDAYVSAAAAEETCGLTWEIIAGIGYVETRHGSWGDSEVGENGVTTERIIGIPLNGRNRTMAIRDSDDGVFDGDTVWDRAVGPMQFIPTTWEILGRDGDGDGKLDPHNLYDAARSTAAHLCKNDARLTNDSRIRSAIFGYNRSTTYVNDVLRRARTYSALDI